jgi:hypothetical protein
VTEQTLETYAATFDTNILVALLSMKHEMRVMPAQRLNRFTGTAERKASLAATVPATSETRVTKRQILLVGPYGVLGTGVIDAVADNPNWGITTAARRPPPAYRAQAAPPHISVDLMERESTTNAFSSLDNVTDLVFAAYVEKPTMAETVGAFKAPAKETEPRLIAPIHYHQQEDIVAE